MWSPLQLRARSSAVKNDLLVPPVALALRDTARSYFVQGAVRDRLRATPEAILLHAGMRSVTVNGVRQQEVGVPLMTLRTFPSSRVDALEFQVHEVVQDFEPRTAYVWILRSVPLDGVAETVSCRGQTVCLDCVRSINCIALGYNVVHAYIGRLCTPSSFKMVPGAVFELPAHLFAWRAVTYGPHWSTPFTHHMLRV